MRRCLIVAPFPIAEPKFRGQARVASMMAAMQLAGWRADCVGIYFSGLFPPSEWRPLDIAMDAPEQQENAMADPLFTDLLAARFAASDRNVVDKLRSVIQRLAPDVIHVETPWPWLAVQEALPSLHNIRVVYSSHNVESNVRRRLFDLGLMSGSSEKNLVATQSLERELAHAADLVISISDIDALEIERASGRPVIYLPASSTLALAPANDGPARFTGDAIAAGCRYAAVMGSASWPNVEAFFTVFREGLGFLAPGEQIWLAGTLANAVGADDRFQTFLSVNKSRTRFLGYLTDMETGDFFAAARCVVVPATFGVGAKMKTADGIASGRPVIVTPNAIEGYGPIVTPALNKGIYVADTPKAFRRLILDALRHDLTGCSPEVRAQLSLAAMTKTWARHVNELIDAHAPPLLGTSSPTVSVRI